MDATLTVTEDPMVEAIPPAPSPQIQKAGGPSPGSTQGPAALQAAPKAAPPVKGPEAMPTQAELAPLSVEDAAQSVRTFIQDIPSDLQVQLDPTSGLTVMKMINPATREVVRQYPAEEAVKMARRLKHPAGAGPSGLLVDENS